MAMMEPNESNMESLSPEWKITGNQSLMTVRLLLIYVLIYPTNDEFYEAAAGRKYVEEAYR